MDRIGRGSQLGSGLLVACGVGVVLAVLAATLISVQSRTLLDRSELTASRGGNQDLDVGTFPCTHLTKGMMACLTPGGSCITCEQSNYQDTGSALGGGNNPGPPMAGSCGDIYNGTCNVLLQCIPNLGGDTGKACTAPPGPPTQQ